MGSPALLLPRVLLLLLHLSLIEPVLSGKPFNVSYDHRAIIIDGHRRMLISAGIHYPRAAPEMWPQIIAKAKDGGADTVETYVFWDGHEPSKGKYNFDGSYDLVRFIKLVEEAGLYLLLRIGPYACAEWNFGGFPVWLRDIHGIEFRTDNDMFKKEMAGFVTKIVDLMKAEQLFCWQGGPIIMAQIENEYGNVEHSFGERGRRYISWAANLAQSLNAGIPWVMCQQNDAPSFIINACNGYYCDGFKPNTHNKPTVWTEDWIGWYMIWGKPVPQRPVEDIAFAIARFFQRGGSFHNYYMYFGGTNFGHISGGPFIATSYDYDAPIDEYGLLRQPKWGHLKDLHATIKLCEPALVSVNEEPVYIRLGPQQEAHIYSSTTHMYSMDELLKGGGEVGPCAAFLANIDNRVTATVRFNGFLFELPPWSVSILPDCKHVAFNTAKVSAHTSLMRMQRVFASSSGYIKSIAGDEGLLTSELMWMTYREQVGIWGYKNFSARVLLDHLNVTKDLTDYLWYVCRVQILEDDAEQLQNSTEQPLLYVHAIRDAASIFINGKFVGSVKGSWVNLKQKVTLKAGWNEIAFLSSTVGLQNYGAFLEKDGAGMKGPVRLEGLPSGDINLTSTEWMYQVGFKGEFLKAFTLEGQEALEWSSPTMQPEKTPLTWYKTFFNAPEGNNPVALDLGSMGKGEVWVNGKSLGRYWPAFLATNRGCSAACDYRGAYNSDKCLSGCGQPTQRWYHVPRAWLQPMENILVLFEEIGGDPSQVFVVVRTQDKACAHIAESHPSLEYWTQRYHGHNSTVKGPELHLQCSEGQHMHRIAFASFGNPLGKCGNFLQGSCHVADSTSIVEAACLGHNQCTLVVGMQQFGQDPCPGVPKSLAVEAICRPSNYLPVEENETSNALQDRSSLLDSAVSELVI